MANVNDLATELLYNIASFVLHKKSLAYGSLVARVWRDAFQAFLFECVTLDFQSNNKLQALYSANPHTHRSRESLLSAVRFLHVWDGLAGNFIQDLDHFHEHSTIHANLLPVFQSLRNLTSICLSHAAFDWKNLSLEETHTVVDLFRQPALREVEAYAVIPQAFFPLCILPLCPNVCVLRLNYWNLGLSDNAFPEFEENVATLIAAYGEQDVESRRYGRQSTDPGTGIKLGLGPVGPILLQRLRLSGPDAIFQFATFIQERDNAIMLDGCHLDLEWMETMDPPPGIGLADSLDVAGLALHKTPIYNIFHKFGANITELRFRVARYHQVRQGIYPTNEVLKELTNLERLDLALDIIDVGHDAAVIIATPITSWFTEFLCQLPSMERLVHVGLIYRILASDDQGLPGLDMLFANCSQLGQALEKILTSESMTDCTVILGLHKSGQDINVWDQMEHGIVASNIIVISSLFKDLQAPGVEVTTVMMADPDYTNYIEDSLPRS